MTPLPAGAATQSQMVCFDGGAFGLASFEVCTEREVKCDAECAATVTLGSLTLLMALYDAYTMSHYFKHFVATRRHLVAMLVSLGMYAFVNAMSAVFTEERLMWGGISSFLRVYIVYSYMLWTMSILFIDGYGDFEELIERTGALLEVSHGKNESWVRSCVLKVQVCHPVSFFTIPITQHTPSHPTPSHITPYHPTPALDGRGGPLVHREEHMRHLPRLHHPRREAHQLLEGSLFLHCTH